MNFRLRQERNAFVFLVVVVTPLILLSAPLPYFLSAPKKPGAQAVRADGKLDCRIDPRQSAPAQLARELRCPPRERPSESRI